MQFIGQTCHLNENDRWCGGRQNVRFRLIQIFGMATGYESLPFEAQAKALVEAYWPSIERVAQAL
jgi:hypothetical protein